MSKVFVTIHEATADSAIERIGSLRSPCDGLELRVDAFDPRALREFDPAAIRASSASPMLYTRRSGIDRPGIEPEEAIQAQSAGFDLVDIEFEPGVSIPKGLDPERVVLSYHDFHSIAGIDSVAREMSRHSASHRKIAATPSTMAENFHLLNLLRSDETNLTVVGLGSCGLYTRILAPFLGSEILFTAADEGRKAAPAQFSLARANEIYGGSLETLPRPKSLFAVVGNPAAHSLSPRIHNRFFRETGIAAAYGIVETSDFSDVIEAFIAGGELAPLGLSITAPFKMDAFRIAEERSWEIGAGARRCGSVNTLVRFPDSIVAENTDLDGFIEALSSEDADSHVGILGAGGTARAAVIAAREMGFPVTVFNRGEQRGRVLSEELRVPFVPISEVGAFDGTVIVNTIPVASGFSVPESIARGKRLVIDVDYSGDSDSGAQVSAPGPRMFDGLALLHAQARRQSSLFQRAHEAREERGARA